MAECIKVERRIFNYLYENQKNEILNNTELTADILKSNKEFFFEVPLHLREDKLILKTMLSDQKGYKILQDYDLIRTISDPELVLDALQINPDIKVIHQKFSSIIKKHGAKTDPYNFLKTYLLMNSLDKELDSNKDPVKGMKI